VPPVGNSHSSPASACNPTIHGLPGCRSGAEAAISARPPSCSPAPISRVQETNGLRQSLQVVFRPLTGVEDRLCDHFPDTRSGAR
jgi:hypothetical protein